MIAVAETTHLYANLRTIDDMPKRALTEIQQFFANYHQLQGKQSRLLQWGDVAQAHSLIEEALPVAKGA